MAAAPRCPRHNRGGLGGPGGGRSCVAADRHGSGTPADAGVARRAAGAGIRHRAIAAGLRAGPPGSPTRPATEQALEEAGLLSAHAYALHAVRSWVRRQGRSTGCCNGNDEPASSTATCAPGCCLSRHGDGQDELLPGAADAACARPARMARWRRSRVARPRATARCGPGRLHQNCSLAQPALVQLSVAAARSAVAPVPRHRLATCGMRAAGVPGSRGE